MSIRRTFLSFFIFVIGIVGFAQAQSLGSLNGQVTDPNKKAVVGATVHLVEVGTQTSRDGKTNDQGVYSFAQVKPGIYSLKVEAQGFRGALAEQVQILISTPTTLNIQLQLGALAEQVVVTAEAIPDLNTEDATIGDAVDESKIKSLPMLGRNPIGLLAFQPGVITTGASNLDTLSYGSMSGLDMRDGTVNGVRGNQMNITLDGSDANDWQNHAAFASALPVTLDSLQEFRVTTGQDNSNEGGASGPQVALVTKSGTNDFHGNVRWYYRTSGPTANAYFDNLNGIGRPKLDRNIPGASLGGHFWKDRLFFFADFEDRQDRSEVPAGPQQVASDALRDGALIYQCDPTSPFISKCTGGSVMGNTSSWPVPAGDFGLTPAQIKLIDPLGIGINPNMLTYMTLFPHGNSPGQSNDGGLAFNAFNFNSPSDISSNIYTTRMDMNITKNGHHTAYIRGTLAGISYDLAPAQFPGQPVSSVLLNNSKGIAIGYTGEFTPHFVNNFRYSFTRLGEAETGNTGDAFSIRFFASNVAFNRGFSRRVPSNEAKDDISWNHGRHIFQFGGGTDIVRNHRVDNSLSFPGFQANPGNCNDCGGLQNALAANSLPDAAGTNTFNAAYLMLTGSINVACATFFGDPKTGAILPAGTSEVRDFAEDNYNLYFLDSWKMKPNVTVTAGVRWEYQSPVWEVNGFEVAPTTDVYQWLLQREQNAFNGLGQQASPLLSWAPAGKANNAASWYHPNYKNFSPRVAIAWSPGYNEGILSRIFGGAGKSSVRAGFGLYFDQVGQTIAVNADTAGSPGTATTLLTPTTFFGLATAPRFSGSCSLSGCTGLPPLSDFLTPPTTATFPFSPVQNTGNQDFVVDPHLKTPYVMNMSLDFQREIGKGVVLDISYVGTLGRRLLTKTDFAESLPLRDPASNVNIYQAFDQIVALAGSGKGFGVVSNPAINPQNVAQLSTIQNIPFFNHMMPNMPASLAGFIDFLNAIGIPTTITDAQAATLTPTQAFYSYSFLALQTSLGSPSWSCAIFDMDTLIGGAPSPWSHALDPNGTGLVLFTPQFNALEGWANYGWSAYHSLQVSVRKRKGNLTFAANYVFSKSMDDASSPENGGTFGGLVYTPFDLRQERSLSDFNLKHNFNGEFGYVLPFGRGQRFSGGGGKMVDTFIGGWELTGIVTWHSGFPESPGEGFNFATDFFLTGPGTSPPLPVQVTRNINVAPPNNIPNIFANPAAALALIQPTLPGLAGTRNNFFGPNFSSFSADVHKTFVMPWSDRQRLQLRVSVYNVFNSVNFYDGGLSLDPTVPNTFGQFSSTIGNAQGGGRQMEFGARFEF